MKNENIENLIYDSLKETVDLLPGNISFEKNRETSLFSSDGILDSLGLVTFLVNLEQKISDEFDLQITIADEKAFSIKNSPFKNIGRLTDYIESMLD